LVKKALAALMQNGKLENGDWSAPNFA
jgi:hypothetical protein